MKIREVCTNENGFVSDDTVFVSGLFTYFVIGFLGNFRGGIYRRFCQRVQGGDIVYTKEQNS